MFLSKCISVPSTSYLLTSRSCRFRWDTGLVAAYHSFRSAHDIQLGSRLARVATARYRHPGLRSREANERHLGSVLSHADLELILRPFDRPGLFRHHLQCERYARKIEEYGACDSLSGSLGVCHDGGHPLHD